MSHTTPLESLPRPQLLRLPARLNAGMQAQVQRLAPEEACGLIGGTMQGRIYTAEAIFPVDNTLHSPVRYRMAPQEQLAAFEAIEARGWEVVGIYHSHPAGPEQPSPTDIAEAYYPEAIYLIWCRRAGEWQHRGFTIQAGKVENVELLEAA